MCNYFVAEGQIT